MNLTIRIFISRLNAKNKQLVHVFEQVCSARMQPAQYILEVIDITTGTAEAEHHKILATPTIIRINPDPERRVIGDLKDRQMAEDALQFLIDDILK